MRDRPPRDGNGIALISTSTATGVVGGISISISIWGGAVPTQAPKDEGRRGYGVGLGSVAAPEHLAHATLLLVLPLEFAPLQGGPDGLCNGFKGRQVLRNGL